MLNILRVFKGARKFEKLHCCECRNSRVLSNKSAVQSENNELVSRKYVKPVSAKESNTLKRDFIQSLFTGSVDKEIFQYPEVLRESDINTVLNHSVEVERFLKDASENQLSDDTIRKLRELELFGLSIPQKYGGAGYNETECKFIQECTGINPTIARFLGYNENACKILHLYGTEEQKEKYLPLLAQGKCFVSLAYSEGAPLVDLSQIKAHTIHDDLNKQYILESEKKWVHNADKADLFFVMARTTQVLDSESAVKVKFTLFIVEKDTPGITVHKLKSDFAQENNLFDVSFKKIQLPHSSILGDVEFDGFLMFKTGFSHNNITDAVLCCNVVKQITHEVIQFIQEKGLSGHSFVQENLTYLVTYLYALESTIYLVTGRCDKYDNIDPFFEAIIAKVLAVDILQIAIKKYIEILGRESFKSSGLLEKAIKTAQYYSVFEENIANLKMACATEGFAAASGVLSQRVKMIRNPLDYNWEAIKRGFRTEEKAIKMLKEKFNFKMELQEGLSISADILEQSCAIFLNGLEELLIREGSAVLQCEHFSVKFGEMAAYIYACMACLSRASSSLCYDFSDCHNERKLAIAFSQITQSKIKELYAQEVEHKNLLLFYSDLGKEVFHRKEYPLEHPLSRTF